MGNKSAAAISIIVDLADFNQQISIQQCLVVNTLPSVYCHLCKLSRTEEISWLHQLLPHIGGHGSASQRGSE